jgi:hypothetical protein
MYCYLTSIGFLNSRTNVALVWNDTRPSSLMTLRPKRVSRSLLFEKGLSLSVLIDNSTALEGILTNDTREGDQDGEDEQDTHDDKGKDPLEGDDVGEELGDTESWRRCQRSLEGGSRCDLHAQRTLRLKPMV